MNKKVTMHRTWVGTAQEPVMNGNQTCHRGRTMVLYLLLSLMMIGSVGRLFYLMICRSQYYSAKAEDLHQRERAIKAARGRILDRNGQVLADNRTVCTIR